MAWFSRRIAEKFGLSPGSLVYIGEKAASGSRLTVVQYSATDYYVYQNETWDSCKNKLRSGLYTWVHVEGLQDIKLVEAVGKAFNVHQMSMEDILNTHHRPKLSDFETYLHFVIKLVEVHPTGLGAHYQHTSVILGEDFVLSFVEKRSDALKPIFDRLANGQGRLRQFGPAYLAFSIIDLFVDHFYLALSRLEEAVDQMETQILKSPSDLLLGRLYEVKRETALMRKMSSPVRDFIKGLNKSGSALIDANYEVYYRDLEDHAVQIVDTCETIKETLKNLLDVSDSYSSHNMNIMFKFFTAVSAIFLPLNFLASVYGMNFVHIPGAEHPHGFMIITGAMSVLALLTALYFRMRRWW